MSKRTTIIIVIVLISVALGVFSYALIRNNSVKFGDEAVTQTDPAFDALEAYIYANIGTLSPEKPVLGGTFYVTRLRALNGQGTVNYEDGHNAYEGTFTYTLDEKNVPTIANFSAKML